MILQGLKVNNHRITGQLLISSVSAVCLLIAFGTQAQDETVLSTITVSAQKQQDPKTAVKSYVAKTSSTASKTGRAIIETQQSVSVITRDRIVDQNARTLAEALNYSAGVVGEPYGRDARFDAPNIRGFDGRQAQFLNGLRMMRTAGATAVEIYGLERVEVMLGPGSVMYGQGNPGGMINMISKRPTFEPFGEVGLGIGSDDHYESFFDVGGEVSEGSDFAYRLTGLARNAHLQTDFLTDDRYFIAPALTWQPDEDTKLTVLTSVQHDKPSSPSGLPYQLSLNSDASGFRLPREFTTGDPSFDTSNRTLTNIGYELEHRLNDVWLLRQNARYSNLDWEYQALGISSAGLAADGRTIRRTATFQDELLNTVNIDNNLQADLSTGLVDHTLLLGLDHRYFDNNVTTEFWNATALDAFNPVYGGPISLTSRTLYTKVDSTLTQTGLYAQDELGFDNWRATLGMRYDWASTEGTSSNPATGASRPLDKDDEAFTGRAGLSYLFDGGIAPYVSYSTSFEPVPVPASGNLLEPTTGEQVEVGVKYQPDGWDGFFSVAAYDLRQKNVLTTVVVGGVSQSAQIGEVRVKGLELSGTASLVDGLDLTAAFTHMNAEIVEGTNNGNRPDNLPENAASLWVKYAIPEDTAFAGLGIAGGVRYLGQRFGNTANTFDLSSVTLFDAGLTFEKNGYKGALTLRNIFDKDYVASCGTFGCTYGEGRTIMGKLTYAW